MSKSYRMHGSAASDMTPAERRQAAEWVASDQIAKAIANDSSITPQNSVEPVYAYVDGMLVDIASDAYAAWYEHYYAWEGGL